jgi:hypothetical protein
MKKRIFMNEMQQIRWATHAYMYADERTQTFKDAQAYLEKVHKKYHTIDPSIINELIN